MVFEVYVNMNNDMVVYENKNLDVSWYTCNTI